MGKLLRAMDHLGYVPRLPVPPAELVSKEKREEWVSEKGAVVFTFIDPQNPLKHVDVFLRNPTDFETAHADRQLFPVGEIVISSVSLNTLIQMKEATGRPRD